MEQIQSKYIVIDHSNNTISLSKKPESLRFRPITDEVFENATIVFNDNNSSKIFHFLMLSQLNYNH